MITYLLFLFITSAYGLFDYDFEKIHDCKDYVFSNYGINKNEIASCKLVIVFLSKNHNNYNLVIKKKISLYDLYTFDSILTNDNYLDMPSIIGQNFKIKNSIYHYFDNMQRIDDTNTGEKLKELKSYYNFDSNTSLLINFSPEFSINGIIDNKYMIRHMEDIKENDCFLLNYFSNETYRNHLLIEFTDSFEFLNSHLNPLKFSIKNYNLNIYDHNYNNNIELDILTDNEQSLLNQIITMNMLIYWNAVSMIFSNPDYCKFLNISRKYIKINNVDIPKDKQFGLPVKKKKNGIYFKKDVDTSLKEFFDNEITFSSDFQIAMTSSPICDYNEVQSEKKLYFFCDITPYYLNTFNNDDEIPNAMVLKYNPTLLNYFDGVNGLLHMIDQSDDIPSIVVGERKINNDNDNNDSNDNNNDHERFVELWAKLFKNSLIIKSYVHALAEIYGTTDKDSEEFWVWNEITKEIEKFQNFLQEVDLADINNNYDVINEREWEKFINSIDDFLVNLNKMVAVAYEMTA